MLTNTAKCTLQVEAIEINEDKPKGWALLPYPSVETPRPSALVKVEYPMVGKTFGLSG